MCFDTELCEVWNEEIRKARKPHACCSCGAIIPTSTLYVYCSGIFQREPFVEKVCAGCDLLKERIVEEEVKHGCSWSESIPPSGEIWRYARESEMEFPDIAVAQTRLREKKGGK